MNITRNIESDPILDCPRCHTNMKKIKKNKVTLDICSSCQGMWIDKGEIEKLLNIEKVK